jgi:hypothetical protein
MAGNLNMGAFPKDFKPGTSASDGQAQLILEQDSTAFVFANGTNKSAPTIEFLSCYPQEESVIEKFPIGAKDITNNYVLAQYKRGVFVKRLLVKNAVRLGNDTFARGAVDLVDRVMTWRSDSTAPSGQLTEFALRFPFDYELDKPTIHESDEGSSWVKSNCHYRRDGRSSIHVSELTKLRSTLDSRAGRETLPILDLGISISAALTE